MLIFFLYFIYDQVQAEMALKDHSVFQKEIFNKKNKKLVK